MNKGDQRGYNITGRVGHGSEHIQDGIDGHDKSESFYRYVQCRKHGSASHVDHQKRHREEYSHRNETGDHCGQRIILSGYYSSILSGIQRR